MFSLHPVCAGAEPLMSWKVSQTRRRSARWALESARVRQCLCTQHAHILTFWTSAWDKVSLAKSYILLTDWLGLWSAFGLIRPPVFRCQLVLTFHPASFIHICPLLSTPPQLLPYSPPPPTVCLNLLHQQLTFNGRDGDIPCLPALFLQQLKPKARSQNHSFRESKDSPYDAVSVFFVVIVALTN